MSKFKDFLNKAVVDDVAKKEIETILGDKKLVDATDEQLAKVSEVAKKLGVDVTAEEIKEFASSGVELDDEELDGVAGGWDAKGNPTDVGDWYEICLKFDSFIYDVDYMACLFEFCDKYHIEWGPLDYSYQWFKERGLL